MACVYRLASLQITNTVNKFSKNDMILYVSYVRCWNKSVKSVGLLGKYFSNQPVCASNSGWEEQTGVHLEYSGE